MADQCARCTSWNRISKICSEMDSMFFLKKTTDETACDHITKGRPTSGVNCPMCGLFMRFVEIEEHPDSGEYFKRFECVCSGVDHIHIDSELVNTSENTEPW